MTPVKKIIYSFLCLAGVMSITCCSRPEKNPERPGQEALYELVKDWPRLPAHLKLGNPTGIDMDTSNNLVVFQRADREWPLFGRMPKYTIRDNTVLFIESNTGKLMDSWGGNMFVMPHGLTVDNQNNIWVTDVGLQQVFKFSHEGKLLMQLGEAGVPGNDSLHFNMPTAVAVARDGSFYVSDGYGNSRIIKFSPGGKFLFAWGEKGSSRGHLHIPHGIDLDNNGHVYVADRENERVAIFDSSGRFLEAYSAKQFGRICAVSFNRTKSRLFATDDHSFLGFKHLGSDIMVFDQAGKLLAKFGRSGSYYGPVTWYHDLAIDKDENIYVADILGNTLQKFRRMAR